MEKALARREEKTGEDETRITRYGRALISCMADFEAAAAPRIREKETEARRRLAGVVRKAATR